MNLSEIRAKYPQYDSISDDVLVQKLHDKYYPQMDINEFSSRVGYISQPKEQYTPEQMEAFRQQSEENNKRAGIDTSTMGVISEGVKGGAKGVLSGLERLVNGATFGFNDWYSDKLADLTGQDWISAKKRAEDVKNASGLAGGINTGLEIIGGIPSGGALYKGVGAGLKAIPKIGKALGYLTPTATGAVSGGL